MRRLFLILTIVFPNIICAQNYHFLKELNKDTIITDSKIAVLIANTNYNNDSLDLRNPSNDVKAISRSLEKLEFDIITKENVTLKELQKIIVEFQDTIDSYDFGLIYYAGHGFEDENGNAYIIPADIPGRNSLQKNCESVNDLVNLLGSLKKNCILILDACREKGNNGLEKPIRITDPRNIKLAYSTSSGKTASDELFKNYQSTLYATALAHYLENANLSPTTIHKILSNTYKYVEQITKNTAHEQWPSQFFGPEIDGIILKTE